MTKIKRKLKGSLHWGGEIALGEVLFHGFDRCSHYSLPHRTDNISSIYYNGQSLEQSGQGWGHQSSWEVRGGASEGVEWRSIHPPIHPSIIRSVMSDSLAPCGLWPARLLCPWDCPGKNTGVGCHFLLQGIFLTQGLNLPHPCLLYFRWILHCLSGKGRPWVTVGALNSASTPSLSLADLSLCMCSCFQESQLRIK